MSTNEKIWKEVNWIHDFDMILSDKNVEIIFIEESNNKSLEVLEKCIVNNKHVMMDKPAGYDFEKFKNLQM